jgi:NADH dehydrogenase
MQFKKICVLGGSGFVGSALVAKLDAAGYMVTVLSRRRDSAKHLILLPNVSVVECNIFDHAALTAALTGADAVINLLGILHQSKTLSFEHMHHELPASLAKICIDLGIKRLLHMSSLRADKNAPSLYLQSKAAGEAALIAIAGKASRAKLNITIFRPSIIFGRDDKFINLFATLVKVMPVILLAKPDAKFQPIWVEDVASCFVNSLDNIACHGKTYELAGPKVYTFRALVQKVMDTLQIQRPIIGLSDRLSYLQAMMMELLPVKLMSRDNVRSMAVDSVSKKPLAAVLGVVPTPIEAVMAEYLVNNTQRGAYDRYRRLAAR